MTVYIRLTVLVATQLSPSKLWTTQCYQRPLICLLLTTLLGQSLSGRLFPSCEMNLIEVCAALIYQLSLSLYGGILHQAYRYYRTYPTDRLVLKIFVSRFERLTSQFLSADGCIGGSSHVSQCTLGLPVI